MIARILALSTVLLTALLLQTVIVPAITPGLIRPDLVALTVIAFALADGPGTGARYGFAAGLVVDLLSVGGPPVGVMALVLLLIGYSVGGLRPYLAGTGAPGAVAVTLAASAATVALFGLLASLLDAAAASFTTAMRAALATALLNGLLAPLVVPFLTGLSRRVPGLPASGSGG